MHYITITRSYVLIVSFVLICFLFICLCDDINSLSGFFLRYCANHSNKCYYCIYNIFVAELIKPPMAGSMRRTSDTSSGIAAVASFSVVLGSLVIGSTAYLILRRLAGPKVSPTTTEGYLNFAIPVHCIFVVNTLYRTICII